MSTSSQGRRALRSISIVAAAALAAGCAAAAATPSGSASSTPDGTAGPACLQARTVVADIRATMARLDSKTMTWDRGAAQLSHDVKSLGSIAKATTDDTAPEAIQDVADAVAAYAVAGSTRTSARASDVLALARGAVSGFAGICPVADGGFEAGTAGWTASGAGLSRTAAAHRGSWAALLTNSGAASSTATLTVPSGALLTKNHAGYDVGVWARSDRAITLTVVVTELRKGVVIGSTKRATTLGKTWKAVSLRYRVTSPGSTLTVRLMADAMPAGSSVTLDDVWVLHH